MTLYSTFVFTLARLLRWLLTGTAYRVHLEDMEDPSRLIQLVEDIKLARSEGDLLLEERMGRSSGGPARFRKMGREAVVSGSQATWTLFLFWAAV